MKIKADQQQQQKQPTNKTFGLKIKWIKCVVNATMTFIVTWLR